MEISEHVVADLDLLTTALNDSRVDIADAMDQLVDDVATAVDSVTAICLELDVAGQHFSVTAVEPGADPTSVASSLHVALSEPATTHTDHDASILLRAGQAGAFTDLAADLARLTDRGAGGVTLDRHLERPTENVLVSLLGRTSVINQAIGVLIARGRTVSEAERELQSRASTSTASRYLTAQHILGELAEQP